MNKKLPSIYLSFIAFVFFIFVPASFATSFDLVPPTGTLQRGQNITFTVNISSEGTSITTVQSGLSYDPVLLQYVSVTPGAAMNSVVADTTTYGAGKVLFTGTNNVGFNGTGIFATVVFTIIAQNPGSTEVCSLWLPEPTASAAVPTQAPLPTGIISTASPTLPPQPTTLPKTGITDSRNTAVIFAVSFLFAAGGVFYLSQKQKYTYPDLGSKKIGHLKHKKT